MKTIIRSNKGKPIGEVVGECFVKKVNGDKHLCRRHQGFGTDLDAVEKAKEAGAKFLKIVDTQYKKEFQVSFEDLYKYGVKDDMGFGLQIFIGLKYLRN